MKCKRCGGTIIHDLGDSLNGPRDYCFSCGREPEKRGEVPDNEGEDTMAYHLKPEKEEEVRALLKDYSIREIVTKTGVASETIRRIRNKNFTEGEKAELKKRATVKGRNKRELKKREPDLQNDGQNIPLNNSDGRGGQEIMTEETKVCTNPKCPKTNPQPIDEFNKNAARPSGRESRCRTCTAQTQRDRKASIEKSSGGTGRSRKAPGNGRKKRQPRDPWPGRSLSVPTIPSEAVTLDAQLLRAVKKSAILDFIKNELPRMVEEAFA